MRSLGLITLWMEGKTEIQLSGMHSALMYAPGRFVWEKGQIYLLSGSIFVVVVRGRKGVVVVDLVCMALMYDKFKFLSFFILVVWIDKEQNTGWNET